MEDDGRVYKLPDEDIKKHAGLETIRTRATYLNGTISIDSQQQAGNTVLM